MGKHPRGHDLLAFPDENLKGGAIQIKVQPYGLRGVGQGNAAGTARILAGSAEIQAEGALLCAVG